MSALHLDSKAEYLTFLKENSAEADRLFQEILIGVTSFFRDPESFDLLKEKVFPQLFKDKADNHPVRLWIAGCSSGEEPYTIAMVVCDVLQKSGMGMMGRVLATDISPKAVEVATENAQSNQVADRVRCRVSDLLTLPEDCRDLAPFEVITANPPYISLNQMISETVKHEPSIALWGGKDGMDFIAPILAKAPELLRSGGALIMEFGYAMADAVRDALKVGARIICEWEGGISSYLEYAGDFRNRYHSHSGSAGLSLQF